MLWGADGFGGVLKVSVGCCRVLMIADECRSFFLSILILAKYTKFSQIFLAKMARIVIDNLYPFSHVMLKKSNNLRKKHQNESSK